MALPTRAQRLIRSLRQFIPSGVILGRTSSGVGPAEFIPVSEATNSLLDELTAVRGSVIFRGASAWQALTPGTDGFFLRTFGSGADPAWASADLLLPYTDFDKMVFQSNFEGAVASTNFAGMDDSLYNHAIETAGGTPQINNTSVEFGSTSLDARSVATSAVRVKPCRDEFQIGAQAFFIEMFIDMASQASVNHLGIGSTANSDAMIKITSSAGGSALRFFYSTDGTSWTEPLGGISGVQGAMRHVVIVRDAGGNLAAFVNGTRDENASPAIATLFASKADLLIGGAEETSYTGNAHWDGVRIGIGTTGGYDPTASSISVPTEYYGVLSNTADVIRNGEINTFYCKNDMLRDISDCIASGSNVTASFDEVTKELTLTASGSNVDVEDDGASIVTGASTLNFTGAGVTVTDAGGNQANIAIPGGGGGGGGGGLAGVWEYVETVSGASVSELDIDVPDADRILLVGNANLATDNETLELRVTTDGFSTVESGASDYSWGVLGKTSTSTSSTQQNDSADSEIRLSISTIGGNATERIFFATEIMGPRNTSALTGVMTNAVHVFENPATRHGQSAGVYNATTAVDGVRLFAGSGNIDDIEVHVYKLNTTSTTATGRWQFVEEVTAASASEIDVPLPDASRVMVVLDVLPATDGVNLHARITDDDFTSVESGASDYRWVDKRTFPTSSDSVNGDTSDDKMLFVRDMGNATGEGFRGEIMCLDPQNANQYASFEVNGIGRDGNTNSFKQLAMAGFQTAQAVNGLRIYASSGNLTSATARVYKQVT